MTETTRAVATAHHVSVRGVPATVAASIVLIHFTAGAMAQTLRAPDGAVACIVSAAPTSTQGRHQLGVQVRVPIPADASALAAAHASLSDFASLPIRVVLLTATGANAAPVQRLPVSVSPTIEHPMIDGAPSARGFVRATFPRDWLVAGAVIVAERMFTAPDGTRVTAQTRCVVE